MHRMTVATIPEPARWSRHRSRIRPARIAECDRLTDLAMNSKASWGYGPGFMEACRAELAITPASLARRATYVATDAGRHIGIYALGAHGAAGTLDLMFVAPDLLGFGVGRWLFDHLVTVAGHRRLRTIIIESDPFAVGFYRRMGATPFGSAPSASVPGRRLPRLRLRMARLARPAGHSGKSRPISR
jgi:GNAT superfamily N-acetyltransferase